MRPKTNVNVHTLNGRAIAMMKRIIPVLAAQGLTVLSGRAEASVVIDISQDGANVVATGSGEIDLAGLSYLGSGNFGMPPRVWGSEGIVIFCRAEPSIQ
jgi:hypothetical protein